MTVLRSQNQVEKHLDASASSNAEHHTFDDRDIMDEHSFSRQFLPGLQLDAGVDITEGMTALAQQ